MPLLSGRNVTVIDDEGRSYRCLVAEMNVEHSAGTAWGTQVEMRLLVGEEGRSGDTYPRVPGAYTEIVLSSPPPQLETDEELRARIRNAWRSPVSPRQTPMFNGATGEALERLAASIGLERDIRTPPAAPAGTYLAGITSDGSPIHVLGTPAKPPKTKWQLMQEGL